MTGLVELDDAISLGISYLIPEYGCSFVSRNVAPEVVREMSSVKNVVAESQRHPIFANESGADDERLSQAVRAGLRSILDAQADIRSVTKQSLKGALFVRRRDHENRPNPRQHQRR